MRLSRLFVFGAIFFLSSFFISEESHVYAQSIDRQIDSLYSYFSNQGISLLDAKIQGLQQVKTAEDATSDPQKATISSTISKYITIAQAEKDAYTTTFTNEQKKGTPPAQAQLSALVTENTLFLSQSGALTVQEKQEPRVGGTIKTYTAQWNNLITQAKQIDNGTITAGSDAANALSNATAVSTAGQSAATAITKTDAATCSLVRFSLGDCLSAGFEFLIKKILLNFAGVFLWIGASLLNVAVKVGILNFSAWAPNTLYPLWVIVRQIISLFVVFAGLYLGFMYIIGREDTFGKYIGWLTLFALFVNFSYPLTRSVIDISNVISLNIYSSVVGTAPLDTNDIVGGNGAGSLIMSKIAISSLDNQAGSNDDGTQGGVQGVPGSLLAVAYTFYAAYILFLAAGMMIFRTAVLVFLTIASPILFVDSVIPLLGEQAGKLRKMYMEQLFVAPVFMIMFALTMKFLEVFRGGDFNTVLKSAGSASIQSFFTVFLMLIMLHIMLKVTKSVGGSMTEFAMKGMKAIGGTTLGLAAGGTALLGRRAIGGLAAKASESGWIKNNQDSFIGRRAYDLSNAAATSSFDFRNSKLMNSNLVAGGLKNAGLNLGKGSQTGFNQNEQAKVADRKARFGRIEQVYKEDGYGPDGKFHKAGEINEEGKVAANRFAATGGGAIFDRKAIIKGVKEVQEKQNTAEEEAAKKVAQEKLQNYIQADKTNKDAVLKSLQSQLDEATKTDPNREGATSRGLVEAIKNIQNTKNKEYDSIQKQVTSALEKIQNMDEKKAAIFKADLSDEVRAGVEAGGMAPRVITPGSRMAQSRALFGYPEPVRTQTEISNPTVTTNGSMPITQSETPYAPVTASGPNTTITNQTGAPVTPNEFPAYQRKATVNTPRDMTPEEIGSMKQTLDVHQESFAQSKRGKKLDEDDGGEEPPTLVPKNPKITPPPSPRSEAKEPEEEIHV